MSVRPSAVAGLFYPGDARELSAYISGTLHDATALLSERSVEKSPEILSGEASVPEAVIVPHAGYIYSGPTAACAYASLGNAALRDTAIRRVVLLGPAHRVAFYGMALPGCEAFATPLGYVRIDSAAIQELLTFPDVQVNDAAHAQEHSLEVQLPFLQTVLGDFALLPVCIGSVSPNAVARVIESLREDANTLFVISSDLSHYHAYDEAVQRDRQSIDIILAMHNELDHEQACGATGINAWLPVAKRHGLTAQLLDYRNSGDTAGDRDRVVGYASIAFFGRKNR
ncbi:MAG: AmmeMemoRadiSam system protein B [Mariprofundus sp.]